MNKTAKQDSVLIKEQVILKSKNIRFEGKAARIDVEIRHDDRCGNGHNTFTITGSIYSPKKPDDPMVCGCIHEEIAEYFPELKPYLKWHLSSTEGPLHYIANTTYFASAKDWRGHSKEPDLEAARLSAIWPDATREQLSDEDALNARLPALLAEFKSDIEALGLNW